ncbi:MAG: cytochrome C554 [Candidatus Abyssobacteria bacterium SURF_17]|jgi:hypothetical protein|uniref:Cytochrome C554 n=1 Tax=Candidatus Abyssobacteria bacterium SURF_17 TaxID=2093361 RepID=A0A419F944_9BACT|nr:MAG: cytochrome C554 [Candidatus Abyssubacteria bacterium SURF_17]
MKRFSFVLALMAAISLIALLSAPAAAEHNYVGVKGCKMCHMAADKGAQYKSWEASKHAKAYETLGTDQAKEVAKAKGIANPQEAAECLKCHVTGYGSDASMFESTYTKEEGVGCESCHGAGKDYKNVTIMKDVEKAKANGLIIPSEEVCKKCHNEESPTFKAFDYKARVAEIAHPRPQK